MPWIASVLGPVHGFGYLVVIALSWQLPAPARVRALSLVPAVGGLLVLRRVAACPPSRRRATGMVVRNGSRSGD